MKSLILLAFTFLCFTFGQDFDCSGNVQPGVTNHFVAFNYTEGMKLVNQTSNGKLVNTFSFFSF